MTKFDGNPKVNQVLQRDKELEALKEPWKIPFEVIGKYVHQRKRHHMSDPIPGEFLTSDVYDSAAPKALKKASAAMLGALFPSADEAFELVPDDRVLGLIEEDENEEEAAYTAEATKRMRNALDRPEANLMPALEEYMDDQLSFGTSGIYPRKQDSLEVPVFFEPIDVKVAAIDEGAKHRVDTVYIKRDFTLRQAVQEYGFESLSAESKKKVTEGTKLGDKIQILQAIEPRLEFGSAIGQKGMPWAFLTVETKQKHILDEGGFEEMPILVSRFFKAMGEVWGRSPAFGAMPDIREINHLRQSLMIATEKWLEPPKAVYEEAVLGGGVLNLSARANNVLRSSGRLQGQKPIELLEVVKDPTLVVGRIEELTNSISESFFVDRLLDLNNQNEMTLGEANIRNQLRGQSLSLVYARQITELFHPLLVRVFNIMRDKGLLGVQEGSDRHEELLAAGIEPLIIPDRMAQLMEAGRVPFKIRFISPAARIIKSEKMFGIGNFLDFLIKTSPVFPQVVNSANIHQIARDVQDLGGAPRSVLNPPAKVKELEDAQNEAAAAAQEAEQQRQGAEALRAAGQGVNSLSQAEGE